MENFKVNFEFRQFIRKFEFFPRSNSQNENIHRKSFHFDVMELDSSKAVPENLDCILYMKSNYYNNDNEISARGANLLWPNKYIEIP